MELRLTILMGWPPAGAAVLAAKGVDAPVEGPVVALEGVEAPLEGVAAAGGGVGPGVAAGEQPTTRKTMRTPRSLNARMVTPFLYPTLKGAGQAFTTARIEAFIAQALPAVNANQTVVHLEG